MHGKIVELHATNKSRLAEQALRYILLLYEIEVKSATVNRIYAIEYRKQKPCR